MVSNVGSDFYNQMKAVTKKNFKLRARRQCLTFCECCCIFFEAFVSIIAFLLVVWGVIDVDDVLKVTPWQTYGNATVQVDSQGTNFMYDPFPNACAWFGDGSMGDEGDRAFEWRRTRDQTPEKDWVDDGVPFDTGLDIENFNTTFNNWLLLDSTLPESMRLLGKTMLANPDFEVNPLTFAVGPGTDTDTESLGYKLKQYFTSRGERMFESMTHHYDYFHACFTSRTHSHTLTKCLKDPQECLEACNPYVPPPCSSRRLETTRRLTSLPSFSPSLSSDKPRERHLDVGRYLGGPHRMGRGKRQRRRRHPRPGPPHDSSVSLSPSPDDHPKEKGEDSPQETSTWWRPYASAAAKRVLEHVLQPRLGTKDHEGNLQKNQKPDQKSEEPRRLQSRAKRAVEGADDKCNTLKTPCECAENKALGCGWVRFWTYEREDPNEEDTNEEDTEDDEPRKRTELEGSCQEGTSRQAAVTSCYECASQTECSSERVWTRLGISLSRLRPKVKIVNDIEGFDKEVEAQNYPVDGSPYCGAIFFTKPITSEYADYEIRLNNTVAGFETMRSVSLFADPGRLYQYTTQTQFLHLQRITDDFITCSDYAKKHGCLNHEAYTHGVDTDTRLLSFPTPENKVNNAMGRVARDLGGNLYFAMCFGAVALAFHLLKERESKVREGMKAMGAKDSVLYLENFLFNIVWTIPTALGTALVLAEATGDTGFPETSTGTFFIVLWLTYINTLQLASLFSSPYDTLHPGALFVFIKVSMIDAFQIFLTFDRSASVNNLIAILPPMNLRLSIGVIVEFERVESSNHFGVVVNDFSLGMGVVMNLVGIIMWSLLYYYFDQCAEKEVGIQRPFNFPLTASYWKEVLGLESSIADDEDFVLHVKENMGMGSRSVEAVKNIEEKDALRVKGLRKVYDTPDGKLTAVDGVDMTMERGKIFALLGHNGAGKTTTLSILTGLTPDSGGDVSVFGCPLREYLKFHRNKVGICPQANVLWDLLTVEEHLDLYTIFKGANPKECAADLNNTLSQLNLLSKTKEKAMNLSGGMKRKLSLAIAFTGNPNLVFLDEPSSGMDVTSRRDTWSILRAKKVDRVIVLTTHFMEEADVLGDRICIMDHGKIRCDGSAEFLKKLYNCGYNLNCLMSGEKEETKKQLVSTIAGTIAPHRTEILSQFGREITILVPFTGASKLPQVFDILNDTNESGVETFSISVSNLEEVFLKAGAYDLSDEAEKGPGGDEERVEGGDILQAKNLKGLANLGGTAHVPTTAKQLRALLAKQWVYTKRNCCLSGCKILCPILYFLLWMVFMLVAVRSESGILLSPASLSENIDESFAVARPEDVSGNQAFISDSIKAAQSKEFGGTKEWILTGTETCEGTAKRTPSECEVNKKNFTNLMSMIDCTGDDGDLPCKKPNGGGSQKCEDGKMCYAKDGFGACVNQGPVNNVCSTTATAPMKAQTCMDPKLYVPEYNVTLQSMGFQLMAKQNENGVGHFAAVVHPNIEPSRTKYYSEADNVQYLMVNFTTHHGPAIYLNQQTNILLKQNGKKGRIRTWNNPMVFTAKEAKDRSLGTSFVVPWAVMFAFGFVNVLTISEVVKEKEKDLKTTQYISGVRNFPYWSSIYALDVTMGFIAAVGIFIQLFIFDVHHLIGTHFDQLGLTVLCFLSFIIAQPPFGFLLSGLFKSSTASLLITFVINLIVIPLFFILIFFAELFLLSLPENPIGPLNVLVAVIHWIFRLFPVFGIGDTLLQTVLLTMTYEGAPPGSLSDSWYEQCYLDVADGLQYPAFCAKNLWDLRGPFLNVVVMLICAVVYPSLVLGSGYLYETKMFRKIMAGRSDESMNTSEYKDDDVRKEEARTSLLPHHTDGSKPPAVFARNVQKIYRAPVTGGTAKDKFMQKKQIYAVQGVSFIADQGEVFGLLGVNGAGKTTLFKMLIGLIQPMNNQDTRLMINGNDDSMKASKFVGYCPQENPLFSYMTCREHLTFYAQIKGIAPTEIPDAVQRLLDALDLMQYANKLAGGLSGGNKRKLCVANALVGSPKLIFMDEPSSGVDPVARRFMWSVIQGLTSGESKSTVILTTHSMEEAEALCSRVVIMVNGVFRCLGPVEHLKKMYGQGFDFHVRIVAASEEELASAILELEGIPTGKHLAPLSSKRVLSIGQLKKMCCEVNEMWRLENLLGALSPFEAASKLCLGMPPTAQQLEERDRSPILVKHALEWWVSMTKIRCLMIETVQLVRERGGAGKLVPSEAAPASVATAATEATAATIGSDSAGLRAPNPENENSENSTSLLARIAGFGHIDLGADASCPMKLHDNQGANYVFRALSKCPLGPLFEMLERLKNEGLMEDYTVSHASLEGIFNSFSKEQVANVKVVKRM